jgi:hypothetical protein
MSLTINVREATNATILQVAGRLTLGASGPSLRDTVRGLLDSLRKNIVLDLSSPWQNYGRCASGDEVCGTGKMVPSAGESGD